MSSTIINGLNSLFREFRQYLEAHIEYTKLDVTAKTVHIISFLITFIILTLLFLPFLLFLSFGLAYYLGALWQNIALGFITMAGGYLLLAILLIIFRKPLITKPLLRGMVKVLFENPNANFNFEDEDDEQDDEPEDQ